MVRIASRAARDASEDVAELARTRVSRRIVCVFTATPAVYMHDPDLLRSIHRFGLASSLLCYQSDQPVYILGCSANTCALTTSVRP